MSEKELVTICSCESDTGYIFKHYFNFVSLRGRPIITFAADKIYAKNEAVGGSVYGTGTLFGEEINLTWNDDIPFEQRHLILTFELLRMQTTFGRILKKDQARVHIVQIRDSRDPHNFNGEGSSKEFTIYLSQGTGGDGREKLQSLAAERCQEDQIKVPIVREPSLTSADRVIIPVKIFRQIVESFTKCKKQQIRFCFYANTRNVNGASVKTRGGILVTTNVIGGNTGNILEKYGEIPEEEALTTTLPMPTPIKESAIVHGSQGSDTQPIFLEQRTPEPHEFSFPSEKINIFSRLASMHNEGSIRVYYEPGCHLKIAHRFGSFGECAIFLHNVHVAFP